MPRSDNARRVYFTQRCPNTEEHSSTGMFFTTNPDLSPPWSNLKRLLKQRNAALRR
ncbi:hypothetical protein ACLB1T_11650 [Escherichia coli]